SVAGALTVAVIPTSTDPRAANVLPDSLLVPLDSFSASGSVAGQSVRLTWPAQPTHGARATYAVLRAPWHGVSDCERPGGTSATCVYSSQFAGSAGTATDFVDRPSPGTWVYRVALSATAVGDQTSTDFLLLSRPVRVSVPG